MDADIKKVLYSEQEIQAVTQRLGQQITADYQGKNPLLVCILKGAYLFMADIAKNVSDYAEVDFMNVSSYGDGVVSTGNVKIIKDLDIDVKGRDVIIVEDIVDTGQTLAYLIDLFNGRNVKSVKVCSLLDKPEGRKVDVQVDYAGFEVPNEFVVGYGLDYAEKYRNLPYIGILKPEIYTE
ncbi:MULTISPECIES: hypoxanthine phosphoribosyltransferase [Dellaglioa]|uniref:Hypoxanthine phosphoribosyltransferase n=1 Tax=Dellaglioa carnosa TaxID=2995136 RepID=A0ABT4JNQ7_9LACO|nr:MULTISPECIES: hypoxanthine phosphoribosyltransferase [Dellaglioa]MCZ2491996.1 hypoxanthine phosphoribosyltransferase [Dellaglioa carnosa]MCZ2492995.1 hypoxanthine phosphoribosyltransferase [Dellaglioa carnosa]MCZ2495045.1 hypoxanthine phosphoribosyltransferase [Dellaglioa carnosa]MDK1719005.1 hypoxanthine phosphoribosyltransferase [Dellaglioa algida]MDK1727176.1 hypoxanthine phosphoribosyltransferase [Dellaglioa algida]